MAKLIYTFCLAILCLAFAKAENQSLKDAENMLSDIEFEPPKNLPYVYHDVGGKKVVSIVVNPIIHNIAHGRGEGQNEVASEATSIPPTTTTPATITPDPTIFDHPLIEFVSVLIRKTKFLVRFMITSAASTVRAIIRFIICTFVPICGLFSVFGDEYPGDEAQAIPEGISRTLNLIQSALQQNRST